MNNNPTALGILTALTNYVVGNGFQYSVTARRAGVAELAMKADVLIREFRDENDWSGDLDRELFQRSRVDGEYFLALWHMGGGHVQARAVEPDQVTEPSNKLGLEEWLGRRSGTPVPDNPGGNLSRGLSGTGVPDLRDSWTFGVHTDDVDAQEIHGYYVQWTNRDTEWNYFPGGNAPIISPDGPGLWMLHARLNVVRAVKRGLSDFYPVQGNLDLARRVLRNMGEGSAVQAAIAWIQETAPGTTQAQTHTGTLSRADVQYYTRGAAGASRQHLVQQYDPATILKVPYGQKYLPGPLGGQHAPNFITSAEAILRTVALRWNLPEHLVTGTAENNNFASSLVAETPFVKYAESQQQFYAQRDRKTLWQVLKFGWQAGRLGNVPWSFVQRSLEIAVTPPQIKVRDPEKETRVRQMLHAAGVLSRKTWSAQEGLDYGQEQEKLQQEAAEAPPSAWPPGPAAKSAGKTDLPSRSQSPAMSREPQLPDTPPRTMETNGQDPEPRESRDALEGPFDPSKHPRGEYLQNRGWFSRAWGRASSSLRRLFRRSSANPVGRTGPASSPAPRTGPAVSLQTSAARIWLASNPSTNKSAARQTTPSTIGQAGGLPANKTGGGATPTSAKGVPKPGDYNPAHRTPLGGDWSGARGTSHWIPDPPIRLPGGNLITSIPYDDNGMPILDKWSRGDITIAISGDNAIDQTNAEKLFGKKIPDGYTFHHDARSMKVVKVDGKDVLVGRMQLVPRDLNQRATHVGSRRAAEALYGRNKAEMADVVNDLNEQLRKRSGPLVKAVKDMPSGKIAEGLKDLLGKTVRRSLPIIGTGLILLDFSENVEAHGLAGAAARATPMLGDLISLHDATKDLADQIVVRANQAADEALRAGNENAARAQIAADAQTAETVNRLAAHIKTTNPYLDMNKIADAVKEFREEVAVATLLQLEKKPIATDTRLDDPQLSPYNNRIKQAEDRLRRRLEAEAMGPQPGASSATQNVQ